MKIETANLGSAQDVYLHEIESAPAYPDEWECPKCGRDFPALFALNRHTREQHNEPKGLAR